MTSWFFIEMALKSALICGVALTAATLLKDRAAADRSMVLRIGVFLLLVLPVIAVALPSLQIEAFEAPAASAMPLTDAEIQAYLAMADSQPLAGTSIWDDPAPLILILWGAGAAAVLARLLMGLATLSRWTRNAEPATDPVWTEALERIRVTAGAPRNLRLLVADGVPGPLGWGWRRPAILLDVDTYAEAEEADAILAHEIAHVAHRDWPALMLTRLATALFWFNPLVWTLAREAVQQAEEAADAEAARIVDPAHYAETLLSWARIGRGIAVPANSIAPGAHGLARRVRAVLEPRLRAAVPGSRMMKLAVILCVGVAAPVAALELVEAARPATPPEPRAPIAAASLAQGDAPQAPEAPAAPAIPQLPQAPDAPAAPEAPEAPDMPDLAALRVLDDVLPQVPTIVAHAVGNIDHAEVARLTRTAAHVQSRAERERMRASLELARSMTPSAEAIRAQVHANLPDPEAIRRQVRASLARSSASMVRGAENMERGAQQMEAQARRLRSQEERERIIARERARGRTVTHSDLIEAAEGLQEGAAGMRDGARSMRESAREMAHADD